MWTSKLENIMQKRLGAAPHAGNAALGEPDRERVLTGKRFSGAPAPSGTGLPWGTATILPWLPAEAPLAHTAHTSSVAIHLRTQSII